MRGLQAICRKNNGAMSSVLPQVPLSDSTKGMFNKETIGAHTSNHSAGHSWLTAAASMPSPMHKRESLAGHESCGETASCRGVQQTAVYAGKMQKGSWIVNTARGAICDREAIVEACESGQLQGYAGADHISCAESVSVHQHGRQDRSCRDRSSACAAPAQQTCTNLSGSSGFAKLELAHIPYTAAAG